MRIVICCLAVLIFPIKQAHGVSALATEAIAAPVKIAFDPSPDESVVGYAVYYGELGSVTTNRLDLGGQTLARLSNLSGDVLHFFYVVAYTADGMESLPSNILYYTPPQMTRLRLARESGGGMQVAFRVPAHRVCLIEFSTSLVAPRWWPAGYATANADGEVKFVDPAADGAPSRFYRAVLLPL